MFANTLRLIDEAGLTYLHVFPFSPRKSTPAAKMPQLARAVVKDRARRSREKGRGNAFARQRTWSAVKRNFSLKSRELPAPVFRQVRLTEFAPPGTLMRGRLDAPDGRNLYARVLEPARNTGTQAIA